MQSRAFSYALLPTRGHNAFFSLKPHRITLPGQSRLLPAHPSPLPAQTSRKARDDKWFHECEELLRRHFLFPLPEVTIHTSDRTLRAFSPARQLELTHKHVYGAGLAGSAWEKLHHVSSLHGGWQKVGLRSAKYFMTGAGSSGKINSGLGGTRWPQSSRSPTGGQRRNRVAPLPRGGYVTFSLIVLIQHILIMFFSSSYYHILPISLPTELYVLSLSQKKKKILTNENQNKQTKNPQ